jgi:hypothetical protein
VIGDRNKFFPSFPITHLLYTDFSQPWPKSASGLIAVTSKVTAAEFHQAFCHTILLIVFDIIWIIIAEATE